MGVDVGSGALERGTSTTKPPHTLLTSVQTPRDLGAPKPLRVLRVEGGEGQDLASSLPKTTGDPWFYRPSCTRSKLQVGYPKDTGRRTPPTPEGPIRRSGLLRPDRASGGTPSSSTRDTLSPVHPTLTLSVLREGPYRRRKGPEEGVYSLKRKVTLSPSITPHSRLYKDSVLLPFFLLLHRGTCGQI